MSKTIAPIRGINVSRAYSNNKHGTVMNWWIRTKEKKYHVKSFHDRPFFYGDTSYDIEHPELVEIDKNLYKTQVGTVVKRYYVKKPKSVNDHRQYNRELNIKEDVPGVASLSEFRCVYENHIEFADRCAVDNCIKYGMWAMGETVTSRNELGPIDKSEIDDLGIKPHIVTIDSEVRTFSYDPITKEERSYVPFPHFTDPKNPVFSIQCLDNQTENIYVFKLIRGYHYIDGSKSKIEIPFTLSENIKKIVNGRDNFTTYVHLFENDIELLNAWIDFICVKDYDIICAFNGLEFDFPYLFARMRKLHVRFGRLSPMGYVTMHLEGELDEEGKKVDETDIRIPGRNLLDTLELFKKKLQSKRSKNSLESFGQDELGVGKFQKDKIEGKRNKFHSIDYMFYEQPEKFMKYATYDVILDYYLQKKMNVWDYYLSLVDSCGVQLFDILQPRKRTRQETLHQAREMKMVCEPDDYEGKKFGGADVEKPNFVGKLEMAADLDIASQYPSLILASNISWDTLIIDHTIYNDKRFRDVIDIKDAITQGIPYCSNPIKGIYFRMDRIGLIPTIVLRNVNGRKEVRKNIEILDVVHKALKNGVLTVENGKEKEKIDINFTYDGVEFDLVEYILKLWDNDQYVLKVKNNSIYGNLPRFLAQCVTALGRKLIAFTKCASAKLGFPSSYSDTDSCFFKTHKNSVDDALKIAEKVADKVNSVYPQFAKIYNLDPKYLKIKTEELYNPIIFIYDKTSGYKEAASKKYVKRLVGRDGRKLADFQIKIEHKGIIKPKECSTFEKDLGKLLIESTGSNDLMEETVRKAKELFAKLYDGQYSLENIAFPFSINQDFEDYKQENYVRDGIKFTNEWAHLWASSPNPIGKGDVAYIVYVNPSSVPNEIPLMEVQRKKKGKIYISKKINTVWAIDDDGLLHPDFEVDYKRHIDRALEKFEPLLRAVNIYHDMFFEGTL